MTSAPLLLTPRVLAQAPELAVLAMLDEALHLTLLSLAAEHPTLDRADHVLDRNPHRLATTLRLANRIVDRIENLRRLLDRYRAAVDDMLEQRANNDDEIPF